MKLFNIICLFFFSSMCLQAQNETWETYVQQYQNGPAGITVRMDLIEYVPIPEYPYILIVDNVFTDKRTDGFPSDDEFQKLTKLSVEVIELLAKKVDYIYAGSFTYNGNSIDYIYLNKTDNIEEIVKAFYAKNYPERRLEISIKEDAQWGEYLNYLFPKENIVDYLADKKVIGNLIASGDNGTIPRRIDHWIYFKSKEDLHNFGDEIQKFDFYVSEINDSDNSDWPIELVIYRNDKADMQAISEITNILRKMAKDYNGQYEGWGTIPVSN